MIAQDKKIGPQRDGNGQYAETNEWGLPDWRDAGAYGEVSTWSLNRWRWEFFRRRKDLRAFFDRWAEITHQERFQCNHGLKPHDAGFLAYGSDQARRKAAIKFDYIGIPNPRIGPQPNAVIIPRSRLLRRARMINGANRKSSIRGVIEVVQNRSDSRFQLWLEDHEAAIKFDLNLPLTSQIEDAKDLLRSEQRKLHGKLLQKRQHIQKWLGYLRTLDAREAEASWSKIASLHPSTAQTEQSGRDIWEQARCLCFKF